MSWSQTRKLGKHIKILWVVWDLQLINQRKFGPNLGLSVVKWLQTATTIRIFSILSGSKDSLETKKVEIQIQVSAFFKDNYWSTACVHNFWTKFKYSGYSVRLRRRRRRRLRTWPSRRGPRSPRPTMQWWIRMSALK